MASGFTVLHPPGPGSVVPEGIGVPGPVVALDANGKFTASGDYSGQLRRIFAAVIPGEVTAPPHPWDSSVPAFVEGGEHPNLGEGFWIVEDVPGARGDCKLDTFVVWYFIEDVPPGVESCVFRGDSTGSGCSSSGGDQPESYAFASASRSMGRSTKFDAAAQVYALTVEIGSLKLASLGAGYLSEGLLAPARMYLTFDVKQSSATRYIWTAQNMGDAGGYWRLSVAFDDVAAHASLELLQTRQARVSRPVVWVCSNWQVLGSSLFQCQDGPSGSLPHPNVRIEPA